MTAPKLSPATITLYETLIRLAKGMLTALEKWLDQHK